ncbi:hypothetical protein ABEB36_009379 [Hypothenemus hampei]|uniref:THAP-type domain-containing protein n=1 Tax=Hypothenemus hampei TaxID=57062 RepID=A0ABD1EGI3_HYPHA
MEFSPNHRKSNVRGNCCVSNCNSKKNKNSNLSFHKVPKLGSVKVKRINVFGNVEFVDKRTEWLKKLNVIDNFKQEFLVCSLHFTSNDYHFPDIHTKLRRLKQDAIPQPFNFNEKKEESNTKRQERMVYIHIGFYAIKCFIN